MEDRELEEAKLIVAEIARGEGVRPEEYTEGWDEFAYIQECIEQGYVWDGEQWVWTQEDKS